MTFQARPGFSSEEMRSLAVEHAHAGGRHPVGGAEAVPPGDGVASPRSLGSGNVALLGRATRSLVQVVPWPRIGTSAPTSLVRCLREQAVERPGDAAFVHLVDGNAPQTTLTYAQLDRRARAIAALPPGPMASRASASCLRTRPASNSSPPSSARSTRAASPFPPTRRAAARSIASHAIARDAGARVALSTASVDRPVQGDDRPGRRDPLARHRRARRRRRRRLDRARSRAAIPSR